MSTEAVHPSRSTPSRPLHEYLPNEIISKIFTLICHDMKNTKVVKDQIVTLRTVCRTWYTIVQATPELYSNYALTINKCGITQDKLDVLVRHAKDWLERSSSHPCDLYFTITGVLSDADISTSMTPLVDAIAGRLRRLQLRGEHAGLDAVVNVFSRELPSLEWLYLRRTAENYEPLKFSPSFIHSKRLTTVELYDVFAEGLDLTNFLPYSQLTSLIIRDHWIGVDSIHHILSSSPNLIECRIVNTNPYTKEGSNSHGVVTLPSLRKFTFTCLFPTFFESLHLPALQELELLSISPSEDGDNVDIGRALAGLYHRAPFQLKILRIQDAKLDVHSFVEFLELVPELKGLHLTRCPYQSYGLFDSLRFPDVQEGGRGVDGVEVGKTLLPHLTEFSTMVVTDRDEILTAFVESRLQVSSTGSSMVRLQSLKLGFMDKDMVDSRILESWKEKGLNVRVSRVERVFWG